MPSPGAGSVTSLSYMAQFLRSKNNNPSQGYSAGAPIRWQCSLTLVGVERDLRRLTNSVGTLGAAVGEIEARLTAIEKRDQHADA
jgi:hypothetical protein